MSRFRQAEQAIAELAARQHGVVSRAQLIAAGVGADAVDRRLKDGRFRSLQRGVYRVGPVEAPHARAMAACLACGPAAVASHWTAAWLWKLLPDPGATAPVDLILRWGHRRSRSGIRLHRAAHLTDDQATRLAGIPVTTPVRTLLDLAVHASRRDMERALAEVFARRLADAGQLRAALERARGRKGSRSLRLLLSGGAPALTRSEAEERFLTLLRKGRLPEPEVNVRVSGFEVDFLWRGHRLVVEVDGFAYHSAGVRFEADRRRDAVLAGAGLRVMRVTWRQLASEPEAVLVRVARALVAGSPRVAVPDCA